MILTYHFILYNYIIELYDIIILYNSQNPNIMKFDCKVQHLRKEDSKEDRDFYKLSFKTYNSTIEGKFERSEIRHLIQILDNAID